MKKLCILESLLINYSYSFSKHRNIFINNLSNLKPNLSEKLNSRMNEIDAVTNLNNGNVNPEVTNQ